MASTLSTTRSRTATWHLLACWRASDRAATSFDLLERLVTTVAMAGVQWINLQYGETDRERAQLAHEHGITIHDWTEGDPLLDLDQFAARMSALDGIISVGNTTVHLAGALGLRLGSSCQSFPLGVGCCTATKFPGINRSLVFVNNQKIAGPTSSSVLVKCVGHLLQRLPIQRTQKSNKRFNFHHHRRGTNLCQSLSMSIKPCCKFKNLISVKIGRLPNVCATIC